jgi:UDP-3-O-[3-hydroxymyristoyl] glucosamine N-acyltransferase
MRHLGLIYLMCDNPWHCMINGNFRRIKQGREAIQKSRGHKKMSLHAIDSIHPKAQIAANVKIGKYTEIAQDVLIEEDVVIGDRCKLGFDEIADERLRISQNPYYNNFTMADERCIIKKGTILHDGANISTKVSIGECCNIGNNSFIRSHTDIGHRVIIGYSAFVGPFVKIDNDTMILNFSVIGSSSCIGKYVFISPFVTLADNKSMLRSFKGSKGPIIEDYVRIGASSVIISCRIGKFSLIGANSTVVDDIPNKTMWIGGLYRDMSNELIDEYMESLK